MKANWVRSSGRNFRRPAQSQWRWPIFSPICAAKSYGNFKRKLSCRCRCIGSAGCARYQRAGVDRRSVGRKTGLALGDEMFEAYSTNEIANTAFADRAANKSAEFFLRASRTVRGGKRILLVDDVLTTGATASAAAKILRKAGAHGRLCRRFGARDRRRCRLSRVGQYTQGAVAA